ncbi:MAG: hypothetical protein DYG90_00345 [Chloroflexi bacterium CFX6]|nr:hypothetical protein [Chloroflexi bacterium CFX6]
MNIYIPEWLFYAGAGALAATVFWIGFIFIVARAFPPTPTAPQAPPRPDPNADVIILDTETLDKASRAKPAAGRGT